MCKGAHCSLKLLYMVELLDISISFMCLCKLGMMFYNNNFLGYLSLVFLKILKFECLNPIVCLRLFNVRVILLTLKI